jgi:hypothetical protein
MEQVHRGLEPSTITRWLLAARDGDNDEVSSWTGTDNPVAPQRGHSITASLHMHRAWWQASGAVGGEEMRALWRREHGGQDEPESDDDEADENEISSAKASPGASPRHARLARLVRAPLVERPSLRADQLSAARVQRRGAPRLRLCRGAGPTSLLK